MKGTTYFVASHSIQTENAAKLQKTPLNNKLVCTCPLDSVEERFVTQTKRTVLNLVMYYHSSLFNSEYTAYVPYVTTAIHTFWAVQLFPMPKVNGCLLSYRPPWRDGRTGFAKSFTNPALGHKHLRLSPVFFSHPQR